MKKLNKIILVLILAISSISLVNASSFNDLLTRAGNKIYVQTLAPAGGDGSQDRPFNNFKDAYNQAQAGDHLVLLDAVTIQSDDQGLDAGAFSIGKDIVIESEGNGQLNSRVPLQLVGNVTMTNMEFAAKELYLNGNSLTMDNVTNFTTSTAKLTIFGGSFTTPAQNAGTASSLNISGSVNNPFVIENIYAGNKTGASSINTTLNLTSGVKVNGVVSASGMDSNVTGMVDINVGNVNANEFVNPSSTENASIKFQNYNNQAGPKLTDIPNVTFATGTNIKPVNDEDFAGIMALKIQDDAKLDLSNLTDVVVAKEATLNGGELILNQNGALHVHGFIKGTGITLKTPGADVQTSGPVVKDHVYILGRNPSNVKVNFTPFATQTHYELVKETQGGSDTWVVREKQIDKPIASLAIDGNNRFKIEAGAEYPIKFTYADADGNPLTYNPDFTFTLKDPNGQDVSDMLAEVAGDIDPHDALLNLYSDKLQPGNYTLTVVDNITNQTFEVTIELYNDQQPPVEPKPTTYEVVFDANGGVGSMPNQTIDVNAPTALSTNAFTREGYEFKGWSTTPDGAVQYQDREPVTDLAPAGGTTTLYAVWEKVEQPNPQPPVEPQPVVYEIAYNANGGVGTMSNQVVKKGEDVVLTKNTFTKAGYQFKGWATSANGDVKYTDGQTVTDLVFPQTRTVITTLYAVWEKSPEPPVTPNPPVDPQPPVTPNPPVEPQPEQPDPVVPEPPVQPEVKPTTPVETKSETSVPTGVATIVTTLSLITIISVALLTLVVRNRK